DQQLTESSDVLGTGVRQLLEQPLVGGDQLEAFLQPAIDQLVHPTPALLGALAALKHDGVPRPLADIVLETALLVVGTRQARNFPACDCRRLCLSSRAHKTADGQISYRRSNDGPGAGPEQ